MEVGLVNELVAHSLGAAFGIENKVRLARAGSAVAAATTASALVLHRLTSVTGI